MGTTTKQDNTKVKKGLRIALNVVLWIFLAFAFVMMVFAFASISNDYGVPVMGDKVLLNVVSESMEPTIHKGDLITGRVLTVEEKQSLKEGDIITFFADINGDGVKEINTHRIVKVEGTGANMTFRTKGDNAAMYQRGGMVAEDDGYTLRLDDIIATWKEGDSQVKGLGSVLGFLQSRVGFLCIVVIPLALFFIYEIVRFIVTIVKVKNDGKKIITAEDEEEIRRKAVEDYLKAHGQAEEGEAETAEVAETAETAEAAEGESDTDGTDEG